MCMSHDALAHNGGLCGGCAPPLRLRRFHMIKIRIYLTVSGQGTLVSDKAREAS